MHYFKKLLSLSLFVFSLSGQALNWAPEVSIQLKKISDLNFSTDGNHIAMVVREALIEGEKSEYLTQIWVSNNDGEDLTQFTYNNKSSSQPRFSPDGQYLAFVSKRLDKPQIWMMRSNGGEAWQFSHEKEGVGSFKWSLKGDEIAFLMKDPKTEEEEKNEKEKKDVIMVDQNFKYSHLYMKQFKSSLDTSKAERITEGEYDITGFDWAPDGSQIVFSHSNEPTFNSRYNSGDLSLVKISSKKVKKVVDWDGVDTNPLFSPDGKLIAFESSGKKQEPIGLDDLYVIKSKGGKPKKLGETPNRSLNIISWSSNSSHVYVNDIDKTNSEIYKISVKENDVKPILQEKGRVTSVSLYDKGNKIALVKEQLDKPSEVYISELSNISPKQISNFNSKLKLPVLAKTKLINWKSKDGLAIEGLLTYPSNYKNNNKYPLALIIHGGPSGVFFQSYTGNPGIYMIEYLASKGYAVLRPNPRGSTGYGKDFRHANFKDWGFGDYEDIMSGVDKVIDMGVADSKRMAVMGWSYGGYMTSFVVTRTNRFKAASMGAGLPNLVSMTTTTDIPAYLVAHMGGEFWDNYETYEKHSAIYRFKNIKTPTQVIHGAEDLRVPFTQGQEFYVGLKRKGVPTEMVVYPRTPHGPREPKLLMDVSPRIMAWLDKYINR